MEYIQLITCLWLLITPVHTLKITRVFPDLADLPVSLDPRHGTCGSTGSQSVYTMQGEMECTSCRLYPVQHNPRVLQSNRRDCIPGDTCTTKEDVMFDAEYLGGWRGTFIMWIKPNSNGNISGTLLHLEYDNTSLSVSAGNLTFGRSSEPLFTDNSYHQVAIQLSRDVGAIFYDDLLVAVTDQRANNLPSTHLVGLLGPLPPSPTSGCQMLTIPECQEFEHFIGSVANITFYPEVLTDREIMKKSGVTAIGDIPTIRPGDCLCSEAEPETLPTQSCKAHNFNSKYYFRADHMEYLTDGKSETVWISNPDLATVIFVVDFRFPILINDVTVTLANFSSRPEIRIETSADGSNWMPYSRVLPNCYDKEPYDGVGPVRWYLNWLPAGTEPCFQWTNSSMITTSDVLAFTNAWRYITDQRDDLVWISSEFLDSLTARYVRFVFTPPPSFGSGSSPDAFVAVSEIEISTHNITSRNFCNCHPIGVRDTSTPCNNRNICQCRENDVNSPDCAPGIFNVTPSFGPVSGGTRVTISGVFLRPPPPYQPVVTLKVVLNSSSVYSIAFRNISDPESDPHSLLYWSNKVKNRTTEEVVGVPGVLTLAWEGDNTSLIYADDFFTYRPDPIIKEIYPRSSFQNGGIVQTVTGKFLDSVAQPFMNILVTISGMTYPQTNEPCQVHNSTTMTCPTPNIWRTGPIGLPDRRRRQVDQSCSNIPNILNCNERIFHMVFILDGVDTYKNPQNLGEQSTIYIWKNPNIKTFKESFGSEVVTFRTYKDESHITIEGDRLCHDTPSEQFNNTGCSIGDYHIEVGGQQSSVDDVLTNLIRFSPPQQKPASTQTDSDDGHPSVVLTLGTYRLHIGYIQYWSSWWDEPLHLYGVIGGACALVLIIIIVIVVCIYRRTRPKYKGLRAPHRHPFDDPYYRDHRYSSHPVSPGANLMTALGEDVEATLSETIVPYANVTMGKMLGKGQFGEVFAGVYEDEKQGQTYPVAVKTVKKGSSFSDMADFLMEATVMKDCIHENVLGLIGTFIKEGRPYVVLPLMENGDLKSYISDPSQTITVLELVEYSFQVARGMNYLSGLKIIHRDLAARNCMINKDMLVKVADFGLARDIYEKEYYTTKDKERPMPLKWMALECLEDYKATTASDVWSFGVLLWELMTRGMKPYAGLDAFELKRYLQTGRRLERPSSAPAPVYQLMLDCWQVPSKRITFEDVVFRLESMILPVAPDLPNERQDYVRRNTSSNNPYTSMAFMNDGSDRVDARRGPVDHYNDLEYLSLMRATANVRTTYEEDHPAVSADAGYLTAPGRDDGYLAASSTHKRSDFNHHQPNNGYDNEGYMTSK